MTLLGTIGMLGMGTVLIGELPRRKQGAGLISAALLTSALGSMVMGLLFIVIAPEVSSRFGDMSHTLEQAVVFAAGVALTAVTLVFDQATIGLMRGGIQLSRNLVFAVVKLALLPAAAVLLHDEFGASITLCWVMGIAISAVLVLVRWFVSGARLLPRPDWAILRGLGKTALAHNWLNLAMTVPRSFIPVLVTVIVSPSANAAFYAAWTITGFLYIIPAHLATVLFAIAAADPKAIARKLRFSLRLSLLIGVPGIAALGLGAHFALSVFGANYARLATVPMLLMLLGYLPTIPKMHYIAVCRATGKVSRAASVLTVSAILEISAAALGGKAYGLEGLTVALVLIFALEGAVTVSPVARAALGYGRHRRNDATVPSPDAAKPKADQVTARP